jgi:hypothetical protein
VAWENTFLYKAIKTHIKFREQKVLGHVVSKRGRQVDPALVKDIWAIKVPQDLTGIQQLLGLVQQAREYVPMLARILEPIQSIAMKEVDVSKEWGLEQDKALLELKDVLTKTRC